MNYIWEGVYKDFSECPSHGDGFNGQTWTERSLSDVKNFLEGGHKDPNNVLLKRNRDNYLPFLLTVLATKNATEVLDFGGGIGFTYAATTKKSTRSDTINYTIVEFPEVCKAAKTFFKGSNNIQFTESITNIPQGKKFDVVHFGSCFQYVEEWENLIESLNKFNPNYYLFTGLLAGNISKYATIQNYYDSKIPVWFLNISDFITFFEKKGYQLIFKSDYYLTYFGKEQDMPMENFPVDLRLKNPVNLLFVKNSESA